MNSTAVRDLPRKLSLYVFTTKRPTFAAVSVGRDADALECVRDSYRLV